MEYEAIDALRERHPAWRLLRAGNATLILSFLGHFFVEDNRGACPASAARGRAGRPPLRAERRSHESGEPRYPKEPRAYLEDWAATDAGYLRRFYPPGDDEVHYEVTPAFEKAYAWVLELAGQVLRRHRVPAAHRGRAAAPDRARHRNRPRVAAGRTASPPRRTRRGDRSRRSGATSPCWTRPASATATNSSPTTARELLSDFREVEENFRLLDRAARERIAAWDGSKGELLAELVGSRSEIAGSDQGRSFQAFYDFLLSESRQDELTDLLAKVQRLDADRRRPAAQRHPPRLVRGCRTGPAHRPADLRTAAPIPRRSGVAGEPTGPGPGPRRRERRARASATTRRPSGSRSTSPASRSRCRSSVRCTAAGAVAVESLIPPATEEVDCRPAVHPDLHRPGPARRATSAPSCREHSSALLSDIIAMHPIEQGAAEIVGYLALDDDEVDIDMDDSDETCWTTATRPTRSHQAGPTAEGDGEATMSDEHAVAAPSSG